MNPNGTNSVHRYRIINVRSPHPQSDEIQKTSWEDLGEAFRFTAECGYVLGMGMGTGITQALEWLQMMNEGKSYVEEHGIETPDIVRMAEAALSEGYEQKHHRSIFGATFSRQRN